MTSPLPRVNLNGSPPWSYELSNFLPLVSVPVYWTCTVSPVLASRPAPAERSSISSLVGPGGKGVPGAGLKSLVGSSTGLEHEAARAATARRTMRLWRMARDKYHGRFDEGNAMGEGGCGGSTPRNSPTR